MGWYIVTGGIYITGGGFLFIVYRTSVIMFKPSWTIIVRSSTNVSSVEYGMRFYWPCFGSGTKSVGKFYKQSYIIKKRDKYKLFSVCKLQYLCYINVGYSILTTEAACPRTLTYFHMCDSLVTFDYLRCLYYSLDFRESK